MSLQHRNGTASDAAAHRVAHPPGAEHFVDDGFPFTTRNAATVGYAVGYAVDCVPVLVWTDQTVPASYPHPLPQHFPPRLVVGVSISATVHNRMPNAWQVDSDCA